MADLVAAVLGAVGDPELMSDAELVGALTDWHAVAARAQGRGAGGDRGSCCAGGRPVSGTGARTGRSPAGRTPRPPPRSRVARAGWYRWWRRHGRLAEEIALALTVTGYAAETQAELAADLVGRLPVAFGQLRAGRTDLARVKVLAEATQFLSDEDAGKVDGLLSPQLGELTTGALKDKARRVIIKIDPAAAERRKQRAERKARFVLYGNEDQTATVAVERMPAQLAAAARARVNAIARAAKAAGMACRLALLEAKVATGLLLDTLPLIPPPAGGGDADGGGPDGTSAAGAQAGPVRTPGAQGREAEVRAVWNLRVAASRRKMHGTAAGRRLARRAAGGPANIAESGDPTVWPGFCQDSGQDGAGLDDEDAQGRGTLPWPGIPVRAGAGGPGCAGLPAWLRPKTGGRAGLAVPWRTLAGSWPRARRTVLDRAGYPGPGTGAGRGRQPRTRT